MPHRAPNRLQRARIDPHIDLVALAISAQHIFEIAVVGRDQVDFLAIFTLAHELILGGLRGGCADRQVGAVGVIQIVDPLVEITRQRAECQPTQGDIFHLQTGQRGAFVIALWRVIADRPRQPRGASGILQRRHRNRLIGIAAGLLVDRLYLGQRLKAAGLPQQLRAAVMFGQAVWRGMRRAQIGIIGIARVIDARQTQRQIAAQRHIDGGIGAQIAVAATP